MLAILKDVLHNSHDFIMWVDAGTVHQSKPWSNLFVLITKNYFYYLMSVIHLTVLKKPGQMTEVTESDSRHVKSS